MSDAVNHLLTSVSDRFREGEVKQRSVWISLCWACLSVMVLAFLFGSTPASTENLDLSSDSWLTKPPLIHTDRSSSLVLGSLLHVPKALSANVHYNEGAIGVATRADSVEFRKWTREAFNRAGIPNVFFVTGVYGTSAKQNLRLQQESEKYGDLVIGNYIDSPSTLVTAQTLSMQVALEYFGELVRDLPFVSYTEDDGAVNIKALSRLLYHLQIRDGWQHLADENDLQDYHIRQLDKRGGPGFIALVDINDTPHITSNAFISQVGELETLMPSILDAQNRCWKQQSNSRLVFERNTCPFGKTLEAHQLWNYIYPKVHTKLYHTDYFHKARPDSENWFFASADPRKPNERETATKYMEYLVENDMPLVQRTIPESDGVDGSIFDGPALPRNMTWDHDYCRKVKYAAVAIMTHPADFDMRTNIRSHYERHAPNLLPVFPVGKVGFRAGLEIDSRLAAEHDEHRDMIIGSYFDTYDTLSTKTAMTIHWAHKCQNINDDFRWLVKTDSDVAVNINALERRLSDYDTFEDPSPDNFIDPYSFVSSEDEQGVRIDKVAKTSRHMKALPGAKWIGDVAEGSPVIRDPRMKNRDVINWDHYPIYCSGALYIMNKPVIETFLRRRRELAEVRIHNEDTMVGVMLMNSGIVPINDHEAIQASRPCGFDGKSPPAAMRSSEACECYNMVAVSDATPQDSIFRRRIFATCDDAPLTLPVGKLVKTHEKRLKFPKTLFRLPFSK